MTDQVELADAEEQHAAAPETFWIPPRLRRFNLSIGDHVKLIFRSRAAGTGERMWVQVTRVGAGRYLRYAGELANVPLFLPLTLGERVEFGPEHVIDIQRAAAVDQAEGY